MFTITFTDINRGSTWTTLPMRFDSIEDARAYAEKSRRGDARLGRNVRVDSVDEIKHYEIADDRNFDTHPITVAEALILFDLEQFELALATPDVIEAASNLAMHQFRHHVATDIFARYDDYQEELRVMAAEFA